jgi:predicted O-methyltransferase YrrM
MTSVFSELAAWLSDKRQPRLEGWCSLEKAEALMMTTFVLRPLVAAEIGVWAGRSLLPVALALREIGRGVVHGIEPWDAESSAEGYPKATADWWRLAANHEYARQQFSEMIKDCRLDLVVRIDRRKSDDAECPPVIDLLHIDGVHTAQARRDVAKFGSKVRVGGIVFVDDTAWHNEGKTDVRDATRDLCDLGFVMLYGLYSDNGCEVYQRVK